jgi:hypothetical protein
MHPLPGAIRHAPIARHLRPIPPSSPQPPTRANYRRILLYGCSSSPSPAMPDWDYPRNSIAGRFPNHSRAQWAKYFCGIPRHGCYRRRAIPCCVLRRGCYRPGAARRDPPRCSVACLLFAQPLPQLAARPHITPGAHQRSPPQFNCGARPHQPARPTGQILLGHSAAFCGLLGQARRNSPRYSVAWLLSPHAAPPLAFMPTSIPRPFMAGPGPARPLAPVDWHIPCTVATQSPHTGARPHAITPPTERHQGVDRRAERTHAPRTAPPLVGTSGGRPRWRGKRCWSVQRTPAMGYDRAKYGEGRTSAR